MNGAILSAVIGVWVLAQLFRGQALERLGIVPGAPAQASSDPGAPQNHKPGGSGNY